MDVAHMREYLVLADCLNFNTAARRLFISQPTLSRHIQSIEDECGVRLLERDRQGVALTPAGEAVRGHFERAIAAYEDALRAAMDADDPRARTVRVAGPSLYVRFPAVHGLATTARKRFPSLTIRASFSDSDDRVQLLLDGAVDAAFALVPHGVNIPGVQLTDIGEARLHLIAPATLQLEDAADLIDLEGVAFAVPSADPRFRSLVMDLFDRARVPRERIKLCDSLDEALAEVMATDGGNTCAIGFDIGSAFSHVLQCVPLKGPAFVLRSCLATRAGDTRPAVADLVACAEALGSRATHR